MYITFAMKQTTYSRYSVDVPKELKHATDEELKKWLEPGKRLDRTWNLLKRLILLKAR